MLELVGAADFGGRGVNISGSLDIVGLAVLAAGGMVGGAGGAAGVLDALLVTAFAGLLALALLVDLAVLGFRLTDGFTRASSSRSGSAFVPLGLRGVEGGCIAG